MNSEQPKTQTCRKCGNTYPFTPEHFNRDNAKRWGLRTICKSCHRSESARYEPTRAPRNQPKPVTHPERAIATRQMTLIEANKPEFSERIRRTVVDDVEYFSLVDIMAEFSDVETRPDKLWNRTKERLIQDGQKGTVQKVTSIPLARADGRFFRTDCADGLTCLRIVQSIPSPKAEPIRQWLASLGYRAIEEAANPDLGLERAHKRYIEAQKARGMSENAAMEHLKERLEGINDFKLLAAEIQRVTIDDPNYGRVVNTEYEVLYGEIASRLRDLLNSKAIRDALPPLQYSYLHTGELALRQWLRQKGSMTHYEVCAAARRICEPLGQHLQEVCEMLGIHRVTGVPLLKRGA